MTLTHILFAVCGAVVAFVLMRVFGGSKGGGKSKSKVLMRNFGGSKVNETDHTTRRERLEIIDQTLEQEVLKTLQRDGKIHAIKDFRNASGWGLKESKEYVDELEEKYL